MTIKIYKAIATKKPKTPNYNQPASEAEQLSDIPPEHDHLFNNTKSDVDEPFKVASDNEQAEFVKQAAELAFTVTLKFEDYASMITCYQALEDERDKQQERSFRMR